MAAPGQHLAEFITIAGLSMPKQAQAESVLPASISKEEFEQRFLDLAVIWKRGRYSSSARLAEHPSYQEIISMGGHEQGLQW
jgi:hypothetical protein